MSSYSESLPEPDESLIGQVVYHESDRLGCDPWPLSTKDKIDKNSLSIGIVDRGTCPFLQKSKEAQLIGLDILLIISEDDSMSPMGANETKLNKYRQELKNGGDIIPTIMCPHSFKIFMQSNNGLIKIRQYKSSPYDSGMFVMIFISTLLVFAGAWYSSDTERNKMYYSTNNRMRLRQRAPIQEINKEMAWSFILIASTGLLTLYFFVSKIFIIIVIVFCIGATNGLSTIFSHLIDYFIPRLQNIEYNINRLDLEFTLSDLIGFIPAGFLSITWFIIRGTDYGWILQNIMCVGLLLVLQRSVRLTNIKIASILLGTAFFYDIFWVFLSPYFFSSSVMVSVATYQHNGNDKDTLPVVLKIPRFDDIFHSPMILGLGDIALPGLFISYLLRYDYLNNIGINWNGYFLPALIGYSIGMLLTDINLILMKHGQPALLFLVPSTLGLTIILSYKRGHLKQLWTNNGKGPQRHSKSDEFLLE